MGWQGAVIGDTLAYFGAEGHHRAHGPLKKRWSGGGLGGSTCNWPLVCAFFRAGAFNAFDKDGDGIIKLNVLEVKPNRNSTLPLHFKI